MEAARRDLDEMQNGAQGARARLRLARRSKPLLLSTVLLVPLPNDGRRSRGNSQYELPLVGSEWSCASNTFLPVLLNAGPATPFRPASIRI